MIILDKTRKKYNFSDFKLQVNRTRAPLNERSYYRGYRQQEPLGFELSLEKIQEILRSGDLEALRLLSNYFYRVNSDYRNNIDFLANLPLYDTVVIPVFEEGKGSKNKILKSFYDACTFVEQLDIPNTFSYITVEWLKNGIFNGLLRDLGDKVVIQSLPLSYCRTRFKDFNNLNILEFNILYFARITDKTLRNEILLTYPKIIQKAWHAWENNQLHDPWVAIPAVDGGICFTFSNDSMPLLIASIPELKKLQDAVGREEKRDENELYKLLIQRMPIDKDGELIFELEEVADIHASVAAMLKDLDTVDVLTTFGETSLESLQESTAASQTNDRIAKYRTNVWEALGRGSILFNPDGSSSLAYAIKKDEALMIRYLNVYETWIKFHINDRFARKDVTFDFEILPLTVFNRQDLQQSYFRGAQYGYSKMFAGVAMGIKQRDQLSLMNFENEFLKMSEKMIPLQSSYTTPGGTVAAEEKNNSSGQKTTNISNSQDLGNKGGRPELPDELKSEKTQANIAAAG